MSLRSSWNGTLRFKELQVPVRLASTVSGSDVALRTLHRGCHQPLAHLLECPVHGGVPAEEQVRGWEISPGEFVVVESNEIEEAIAAADELDEHVIETEAVVALDDLDPAAIKHRYFLLPTSSPLALRAYALLLRALVVEESALLVRFKAFTTENVASIRPLPGRAVLLVETLAAATDILVPDEVGEQVDGVEVSSQELELARELLTRVRGPLDRGMLRSDRRDAVRELLERKRVEQASVRPVVGVAARSSETLAGGAPMDLLAQLKASVKQAPKKRRKKAAA